MGKILMKNQQLSQQKSSCRYFSLILAAYHWSDWQRSAEQYDYRLEAIDPDDTQRFESPSDRQHIDLNLPLGRK